MSRRSNDDFRIDVLDGLEFERMTRGYQPVLSNPLEVTDGYDATPRPFELDQQIGNKDTHWIPSGHIAFKGDFEDPS